MRIASGLIRMNGDHLLDTNIVSAILDSDPTLASRRATTARLLVPSIVIGELHYGAANSSRRQQNVTRIEAFTAAVIVLDVELETGRRYGDVRWKLKSTGKMIPENDMWIAAL